MKKISFYDLLISKSFVEAFQLANQEYMQKGDLLYLRNRANASLCMKLYREALLDYLLLVNSTETNNDSDYIYSGICHWFLDEQEEAIEVWQAGLTALYTDAAGGVSLPSLLYFAAISRKDESLEKEAISLLKKRWGNTQSINWPGAIAGFILSAIDEAQLLASAAASPRLATRYRCQAGFYQAIKSLKDGDKMGYITHLAESISFETFLEPEYYLALGELEKLQNYEASVEDFLL